MSKPKHRIDRVYLARLRAIRLHHWDAAMSDRRLERFAEDAGNIKAAISFRADANLHLTFVQTLNEFFEIGDTAENDANKRDESLIPW